MTAMTIIRRPVEPGARVEVADMTNGAATFVRFAESGACPPTHVSSPGCRIALVRFDDYAPGRDSAVWEDRVLLDGEPVYEARRA